MDHNDLDLRRYLGLFLSNWFWFVAALFFAVIIVYGINTYSERVFTVSASLLIKDDKETNLTGLDRIIPGGDMFRSQQNLQNEIGILKSFNVNSRVMNELKNFHVTIIGTGKRNIAQIRHYKTAPFIIAFDSLQNQRAGVQIDLKVESDNEYSLNIDQEELRQTKFHFGEEVNEAGFHFRILKKGEIKYNPDQSNKYIFWFNRPENLANYYRGKLNVQPINEDASLVTLSTSGVSSAQEADYLNCLMSVYIQQGLEYKNQTAEKTIEFIDNQLGLISDSLSIAENKLEEFKFSNKMIDLSSEGSVIKEKLERFSQEKFSMELQKQYYEYLSNYIATRNETGEILSPSVMGVTDPLLISLVEQLTKLQQQKKHLKYNYSSEQPAITLIDSEIEDARLYLDESVKNNIVNSTRTLESIDSRMLNVETELNRLPQTERKLINIQRTFDLNNAVYTYMLEKRSEAGIARASNVSGNRIIDSAEPYNATLIRPRIKRNYIIAIILGILVPGLYIIIIDQVNNKILDKTDIEKSTEVPILGFVGHNTSNGEMAVIEKPGSTLAESFRTIRTNLKYYLNGSQRAIISVTSTISGEGKTFFSLNLAIVLAMLGKKTLLVGMDLRKPRLNKILNVHGNSGLSTYLIYDTDYEKIIFKTKVPNLYFIPSGEIPPNPSELLESEMMKSFMGKIKEEFDYIVMDTPPVGIVSDALLLGNFADLNIFVIRQKYSFKSTLDLIQNIYKRKDLKNLTIAVNDIHISGYYGFGLRYGYGFYKGYGYNYGYNEYGQYNHDGKNNYYTD
jgi:capsular exopolysaccharide synthesis family protein